MSVGELQSESLEDVAARLDQKVQREQVDVGYAKKETNGDTTVYEAVFAEDEELQEYLDDIEVSGYCDVERILLDMNRGRAVMDTENSAEQFDKVYEEVREGKNSYFLGHTYGKETGLMDFTTEETTVQDMASSEDEGWKAGDKIHSRLQLLNGVMERYELAEQAAIGQEYGVVLGASLEDELNSQGQVREKGIRGKMEDTLEVLSDLDKYQDEEFESFGDLVNIMDKQSGKKMWKRLSDSRLCQADLGNNWRLMAVSGSEFNDLHDKTVYGIGVNRKGDNGTYGQQARIDSWSKLSRSEIAEAVVSGHRTTKMNL